MVTAFLIDSLADSVSLIGYKTAAILLLLLLLQQVITNRRRRDKLRGPWVCVCVCICERVCDRHAGQQWGKSPGLQHIVPSDSRASECLNIYRPPDFTRWILSSWAVTPGSSVSARSLSGRTRRRKILCFWLFDINGFNLKLIEWDFSSTLLFCTNEGVCNDL